MFIAARGRKVSDRAMFVGTKENTAIISVVYQKRRLRVRVLSAQPWSPISRREEPPAPPMALGLVAGDVSRYLQAASLSHSRFGILRMAGHPGRKAAVGRSCAIGHGFRYFPEQV